MHSERVESMIREYIENKRQADELKARNDELATRLAELAVFKPDCDTARLEGAGHRLTIRKRMNERWNQEALKRLRSNVGDDFFFTLFREKYEPQSASIKAFMKNENDSKIKLAIWGAVVTSMGRPSITVEALS